MLKPDRKKRTGDAIGHITYQLRGRGKIKPEYAKFSRSVWRNGRKEDEGVLWLGKVLNKKDNIFKSRKYGIFQFTPPDIIKPLSGKEKEYYKVAGAAPKKYSSIESLENLSFGGIYLISELMKKSGLTNLFMKSFAHKKEIGDAAMSLVLYKLTHCSAFMHAKAWWDSSYARLLYPNVNLDSPRISEMLAEIGKEKYWRIFFENYVQFVKSQSPMLCALIDSTGLPNAIQCDLSQTNNHNGNVNREIRLIAVLEQNSGYPLYIKYVPGNIVDKSTLVNVFCEMDAYDIEIATSIMDAGYYTEENLKFLYKRKIGFVTRHIPNTRLYKQIMENDIHDIDNLKYHILKDERLLKIKRIDAPFGDMELYAYICKDLTEANKGEYNLLKQFVYDEKTHKEICEIEEKLRKRGIFVLLSSLKMPTTEILPFYYKRQDIEQIFDLSKNDVDLLPLRVHSENTLRGHLFVILMATITHVYMRKILDNSKDCKISRKAVTEILNMHMTNVYPKNNFHVPGIPIPLVRKIYKTFKIDIPSKISITGNNILE
jgi:hypothetical protein